MYKKVVEETLEFIKRELTDASGGFYSSLDADSEGEEGKFYVFTAAEIDSIIGNAATADIFKDYYQIKKSGNWEHGKNILHIKDDLASFAKKHKLSEADALTKIEVGKKKLFDARASRIRPGLDDKVLTAWNALMLKGYIDAYKAFGNESYLQTALKNAEFLEKNMLQSDSRLNRNYKDGKSVINAFLDDYALLIDAYIALYEITFDEAWLQKSKALADYAIEHFYNDETGMFYYTSKIDPPLVTRKTELADNVIPGSNSAMARALFTLGTLMYETSFIEKAEQMLHNMNKTIVESDFPNFYSNWCGLYLDAVNRPYEVAILGEDYKDKALALQKHYFPNALFLGGKSEGNLELLKDKLQEGETMIYVCQNKVCKFPVTEANEALDLLRE